MFCSEEDCKTLADLPIEGKNPGQINRSIETTVHVLREEI
jgi:hypothetical protein